MIQIYDHVHANGTKTTVFVDSELRGKHREHGLCYNNCLDFKPGQPDNCEIAQSNYEQALKFGIVTPVYECPRYNNPDIPQYFATF